MRVDTWLHLEVSNAASRAEVDEIIANDPFYKKEIASYNVIEFNPVLNSVDNFIKALGK